MERGKLKMANISNLKDQQIVEQCKLEVQAILDKYKCRMEASVLVKASGNIPQVAIVKND